MRCVDVIRELSAPTGTSDSSVLAEHLARCPHCTAWAERAAQLDRLWEATRPVEPSTAAWDTAWVQVSSGLDHGAGDQRDVLPLERPAALRPRRRALFVALGAAQAAAVLLAVLFFARSPGRPQPVALKAQGPVQAAPSAPISSQPIDISTGVLGVIHCGAQEISHEELALNDNSAKVDSSFLALNSLEAIAEQ